jgi:hypothetical protein
MHSQHRTDITQHDVKLGAADAWCFVAVHSGGHHRNMQVAPHCWLVAADSPLPPVPDAGEVAVLALMVGSSAGAAGMEKGVGSAPICGI